MNVGCGWFGGCRIAASFSRACAVGDSDGRRQPVSLADDGLENARLVGVVLQGQANFADGGVDALPGVDEHAVAPELLDDLLSRHQLAFALRQQDEQFHGDSFQLDRAPAPPQFVTAKVELEFVKFEDCGCHGPSKGSRRSIPSPPAARQSCR